MTNTSGTMLYVPETPWHNLGVTFDSPPKTSRTIAEKSDFTWEVDATRMYTDQHSSVLNYHAIYRTDTNSVLGVVNSARPHPVQNVDAFEGIEDLLDKGLTVETAMSLNGGAQVVVIVNLGEHYKIIDDDVQHNLVLVNDHTKSDGKVSILHTPVRIACMNMMNIALQKAVYFARVPAAPSKSNKVPLSDFIMNGIDATHYALQKKAKEMLTEKIDESHIQAVLDMVFPITPDLKDSAVERIEMNRNTFVSDCLGADNLQNYRGTTYQVFNALVDYTSHYFNKADKMYDLTYRMKAVPGITAEFSGAVVNKYLSVRSKLAA